MTDHADSEPSTAPPRRDWRAIASQPRVLVVAVTVLALAVRLLALGSRVAHQDEARVAYWALRYVETGVYWYRPIVHGPFLALVDGTVFELFGASDLTMRLVVAVVGGLLPLSALLFRDRLRDVETVVLALVLAANPVLLYYSRFYRNDVLLAGFMLVALGWFVRAVDHRRPAALYAGTAVFALAFTTKENALVYPLIWAGALVLLWDRRLLTAAPDDPSAFAATVDRVRRTVRGLWDWLGHLVLAGLEFLVIVVFFYAPRGAAAEAQPTLGATLADPTLAPALVSEATLGSWRRFTDQWVDVSEGSYLTAAGELWAVMAAGGIVVVAFAVVGFLVVRYDRDRPGDLVEFTFFWGLASVLGYPIIVDNPFPWETVHMLVPLTVPAAVGLATVARFGFACVADGDRETAAAVAIALLAVSGHVGWTAVVTSFVEPQSGDNDLVQYAQSSSDMRPLLEDVQGIARGNDGVDVLYYGDEFDSTNESAHATPPPGGGWFDRLPFAWYLETANATVDSTTEPARVEDDAPPVVIALGEAESCDESYQNATDVADSLSGYDRHEVQRYAHDSGCTISSVVVFVDAEASG